ncbi:MAG: hypothetical protein ACW99A_14805 [Candidatus Kariarchaeaceae archaeon]|jgi:hypothetical protein
MYTPTQLFTDNSIDRSHSSPLANGVAASLFSIDENGVWINPAGLQITTSEYYVEGKIRFEDLVSNQMYVLLIYYSDGWSQDWDQTIYIKNMDLSGFFMNENNLIWKQDNVVSVSPETSTNRQTELDNQSTSIKSDENISVSPEVLLPVDYYSLFLLFIVPIYISIIGRKEKS